MVPVWKYNYTNTSLFFFGIKTSKLNLTSETPWQERLKPYGGDHVVQRIIPAPSMFAGSIFVAPDTYASVTTAFFIFAPLTTPSTGDKNIKELKAGLRVLILKREQLGNRAEVG